MSVSVTVEAGESVNVRFDAGELSELVAPNPTQSTYSLQFLDPLTRKLASGLTDSITLEFQDKYPLRLTWNSNDGGASSINISSKLSGNGNLRFGLRKSTKLTTLPER